MKPDDPSAPRKLDDLLGLDPDPRLSAASKEALGLALGQALGQGLARARDEEQLDRLLGRDAVEVPAGLAERVLEDPELVAARREATLVSLNQARPFPLRRIAIGAAAALAAAAALILAVLPREQARVPAVEVAGSADSTGAAEAGAFGSSQGALASWEEPSDELLAALPVLESMDLLTEDLDPFEADVMLLFDADELLMLELLEGGASDGEDAGQGAPAAGGKKKG